MHQRGYHHPHRHGTDRLGGEHCGIVTALASKAVGEAANAGRHHLTRVIEHAADPDCQQEVHEQQSQIACLGGEPAGCLTEVGGQLGKQYLAAARQDLLPELIQLGAHQRDLLQPEQLGGR